MKVLKMDKLEATIAMKEGDLIMNIDHPNVLRYDEFFYNESSKQFSIVMQYLPCKKLLLTIWKIDGTLQDEIEK